MNKMSTYLSQDVLNKLKELPDDTIIKVIYGEIIIFNGYRNFEDGIPTHHFKSANIWQDKLEEK